MRKFNFVVNLLNIATGLFLHKFGDNYRIIDPIGINTNDISGAGNVFHIFQVTRPFNVIEVTNGEALGFVLIIVTILILVLSLERQYYHNTHLARNQANAGVIQNRESDRF